MKFRWLISVVLLAATSYTTQSKILEATQSSREAQPTPEASPSSTSAFSVLQQAKSNNCDSAYPDVCIPLSIFDLDCSDIAEKNFEVLAPDPHRFDGQDLDGSGCDS